MVKATHILEFFNTFEKLRDDVIDDLKRFVTNTETVDHISESVKYNIFGGKMIRGLTCVNSIVFLNTNLTHEQLIE